MNELITRITGLTYDLFGIILPGAVAALFLVLWWLAVGGAVSHWTGLPTLTLSELLADAQKPDTISTLAISAIALTASYFAGHLLQWIGRSGPAPESESAWRRTLKSLCFRMPKPKDNYDPKLEQILAAASTRLSPDGSPLAWKQFYPLARAYLSGRRTSSLVPTFQNKYTLHRSITTAAAAWFWLCITGLIVGEVTRRCAGAAYHPGWLCFYLSLAITLIWGFSGSYLLYWQTFGNTVIAEVYTGSLGDRGGSSA